MTIEQYKIEAARTCPSLGSTYNDLAHMNCGIATEFGEILDQLKRKIAYNKEIDLVNLEEEIGDVAWYVINRSRLSPEKEDIVFSITSRFIGRDEVGIINSILGIYIPLYSTSGLLTVLCRICNKYDLDFYKCLDKNIAKLYASYLEKFT